MKKFKYEQGKIEINRNGDPLIVSATIAKTESIPPCDIDISGDYTVFIHPPTTPVIYRHTPNILFIITALPQDRPTGNVLA